MPMPIPDGEAERAVKFSVSSIAEDFTLRDHAAHLIVTLIGVDQGADSGGWAHGVYVRSRSPVGSKFSDGGLLGGRRSEPSF